MDNLDAIAVGILDKETVRAGNGRCFLNGDPMIVEVSPSGRDIGYSQGEMPGADRIRPILEQ